MEVRFVDEAGVHERDPDDVLEVYAHDDGFLWIDVPSWDERSDALLAGLGCHAMLREACARRNYIPTVHRYQDHVFITTQSPMLGTAGHVHLLELDQIVGRHFLVTVHGPLNPEVDPAAAQVETEAALRRISGGRFRPTSPAQLSYAITSGVARRQRSAIADVSEKLPGLEKHVMSSQLRDPEVLLETMFLIRHELITARTTAAQCHDVWMRMATISRFVDDSTIHRPGSQVSSSSEAPDPFQDTNAALDLADQFDRVRSLADGEAQFLFGVIELYQTKVHTKMTVAMERLAVIAAVTLPVTAIASIYGMNVIVNEQTHYGQLGLLVLLMAAISLTLLRWARRQGWW